MITSTIERQPRNAEASSRSRRSKHPVARRVGALGLVIASGLPAMGCAGSWNGPSMDSKPHATFNAKCGTKLSEPTYGHVLVKLATKGGKPLGAVNVSVEGGTTHTHGEGLAPNDFRVGEGASLPGEYVFKGPGDTTIADIVIDADQTGLDDTAKANQQYRLIVTNVGPCIG